MAVLATAIGFLATRQDPILWTIFSLFLLLAVVSFVDDLRGLKASTRLGVQLLAAGIVVGAFVRHASWFGHPWWLTVGFGVTAGVWIAGYTNAFNFMDGINGIAGLQALTAGAGSAAVAIAAGVPSAHPAVVLSLATAGAALGFLPHNFPRARVFMGDVSSASLGFFLAVVTVWIAHLTSPWMLFWLGLLHANFVLDTGLTLIRRTIRGQRLGEAHRDHFYQRWVRAGRSHTWVSSSEFGLQVVVGMSVWGATGAGWLVRGCVALGVVILWGAFFCAAERAFRKSSVALVNRNETGI